MTRSLPSDRSLWTPEETKNFLEFYAGVLAREAGARQELQPAFAAELHSWADKARKEAAAIDTSAQQMELFE